MSWVETQDWEPESQAEWMNERWTKDINILTCYKENEVEIKSRFQLQSQKLKTSDFLFDKVKDMIWLTIQNKTTIYHSTWLYSSHGVISLLLFVSTVNLVNLQFNVDKQS